MKVIVPIVEGQSEEESLPPLLRRLIPVDALAYISVRRPIRVKRQLVVKPGELERTMELAARQENCGGILLLLDADDDCPAELGPSLVQRMRAARSDIPCRAILAKSEYEAWLIAGIESLRGVRGIPTDVVRPAAPEEIRGAKGWLGRQMPQRYVEVDDQPALSAKFDLDEARLHSDSLDTFIRAFSALLGEMTQTDLEDE